MKIFSSLLLLLTILPAGFAAGQDILPFEANDTLEDIRYKIDHNGYSFEVSDNWVFNMSSEEKSRFFSRRAPAFPRARADGAGIGPLGARLETIVLPDEFDWRSYNGHTYIGDIRDQGTCGSCYSFGACAAAEGTYNWATGNFDGNCADFSESYIIWCLGRLPAYSSHFFGCAGADYDYMELEALTVEGVCNETDFPYQESDPGSCTHWGDQTTVFQSWHRVPCNDTDAIKTAIMTYGVVDAAVYVGSAFEGYAHGIYEDSNTSCSASPCYNTTTNHAIALVGWDDSPPEGGGGVWILRNSWGTSWGESGYMRIRYTSAAVSCAVCYLVYQSPASPSPTPIGFHTPTPPPTITPTPEGFHTPPPSPTPSTTPSPAPYSIPFSEDFEGAWSGGAPAGWTREYVTGTNDWTQTDGGYSGHPASAHGGSYNARFFYDDWSDIVTRLISPRLEFGPYLLNTRLDFWLAMEEWDGDQDELSVYYRTSAGGAWNLLTHYDSSLSTWTERTIALPEPGDDYYICFQGTANYGYGICLDDLLVTGEAGAPATPTPAAAPLPIPDFNGDGTTDIAIYRESFGLWAVRGITRIYFGIAGDQPVPGDYDGDRTTDVGIFRESSGLWALKGVSRFYFGQNSDTPLPGDYNGDGTGDTAIFREGSGLWAIRSISRTYFGQFGDTPVPGYYSGDGSPSIGIFRGTNGLWAIQAGSRFYFGQYPDEPVSGDYNGTGAWSVGIYRPSQGLWALRGITRVYFGNYNDWTVPGDYNGDGTDDITILRQSSGLWAIRSISRFYFGGSGDIPIRR